MDTPDDLRNAARKRLKAKADFRNYLFVWLGVTLIVTTVWALTSWGGYFWPAWVIAGMGIGAFFQALSIYGPGQGYISESAVDAEVRRMNGEPKA
jgi:fatty acid desaturase